MKTKHCNLRYLKNRNVFSFLLLLFIFGGCTEIFEPELSEEVIELIAPPNQSTSSDLTQTFWWSSVEYAEEYNFQLVSPSFLTTHQILVDTFTTELNYSQTLIPGSYEWRVAAFSNSSQTAYSSFRFTIDSSSLIVNDSVQLISPHSNDTSKITARIFKWLRLNTATSYKFNLYYENNMVYSKETEADTLLLNLNWGDGSYEWQVRGQNEVNQTAYVNRTFYLDTRAPDIPTLLSPIDNLEIYDTIVKFKWNRMNDNGADVYDNLAIYKNVALTDVQINVNTKEVQYENYLDPGTYYWHVRSVDAAGNEGAFTQVRKLNVISRSVSPESVLLMYPLVNDTLNKTLVPFSWLPVKNAKAYQINLYFNSALVYTSNTSQLTLEIDLIWGEGTYKWELKAFNDFSSTEFSSRNFYIDITPPGIPELISPENNFISNDSVQNFKWVRPLDFGSTVQDSLYLYGDSLMTNLVHKKMIYGTNYVHELDIGNFYWRVRSADAVGNLSDFSEVHKLMIIRNEE